MEKTKEQKVTWKDKVKTWAKFHKDEICLVVNDALMMISGIIIGKHVHKRITAKEVIEFNEYVDEQTNIAYEEGKKVMARIICPKENVKYVVERFGDTNGKTYEPIENYIRDNYTLVYNMDNKED